jgi:hypothetical protein
MARGKSKKAQGEDDIAAQLDHVTGEILAALPDVARALEELAAEEGTTVEEQLRPVKEMAIRNLTKATIQ